MPIVEPTYDSSGVYSGISIGKDVPAMGPFKSFKPKIIGPGSGKAKLLFRGGKYVYNYLYKYPKFSGSLTGIGGSLVASQYTRGKARGAEVPIHGGFRRFGRSGYRKRTSNTCCCNCNKRKRR